jgi:hypothetical protein
MRVQELAAPLRAQPDHYDRRHRDHAADPRQRVGIVTAFRLGDLRLERTVVGSERIADPDAQLVRIDARGGPVPTLAALHPQPAEGADIREG